MKKRRKKSKVYFGTPVHDAIIEYNKSEDTGFRHKIYTEQIHPAFMKLAENIINTFKFSYFSYGFRDLQEEVVSNLVLNMHKFDHNKGSKAFSYFSVVAKNYLILNNNANYKKLKIHDDIDVLYGHGQDNIERLFPKSQDRDIAESILYLCRHKDNIDNFNKKAIYIMIREMTDVKTSKITQVTNTFRKVYPKIQEEVLSRGHIDNLRYTGSLI